MSRDIFVPTIAQNMLFFRQKLRYLGVGLTEKFVMKRLNVINTYKVDVLNAVSV